MPDDAHRTAYAFKRNAIQHSLYGVDIEPSAVDIAQLRLWLSLVVDEDDFQTIQPLPNLRYRIVRGDALGGIEHSLENNEAYDRLQRLIPQHIEASSLVQKERLQEEIDTLIEEVTGGAFDFGVFFGDVLQENCGFDVVIGNPPYVRQESLTNEQKGRYKKTYQVYAGSADLYTYFIERGMALLRPGGVFAYIVSNKWLRARYGTNLRQWLKDRRIVEIIDFGDLPVFQGATTYPCILRLEKGPPAKAFGAVQVEHLAYGDLATYTNEQAYPVQRSDLREQGWSLATPEEQRLLKKLRRAGRPLGEMMKGKIHYGIKTGYNKAFVINAADRARLIADDPKSADLIKPFLAGRDVKRYRPPVPTKYVIFTRRGVNIDAYPTIKKHLAQYRAQLEPKPKDWKPSEPGEKWPGRKKGNYAWYEIQDTVAYYAAFDQPKITIPAIEKRGGYTLDRAGIYSNDKTSIISDDNPFLLGLLNSQVLDYVIYHTASTKQGGYFEYKPMYVDQLPIFETDDTANKIKNEIAALVEQLLELHTGTTAEIQARRAEIQRLEREVDNLVYTLYGLTDEEIALIERRVGNSTEEPSITTR